MAYKIIWTEKAIKDIEEIGKFIEKDSFNYACSVVSKIIEKVEILKNFPYCGRIVPEKEN